MKEEGTGPQRRRKSVVTCNFQVANGRKPLIAVKRIVQRGNLVQFGELPGESSIYNKRTGNKLPMYKRGRGSFVVVGRFAGGEKTEATVDSAAEESVSPPKWGEQFEMRPAEEWMNFTVANGASATHYGQRDVQLEVDTVF